MPKLYATDEVVNGHECVGAALDDPFWVGEKGYAPRDEAEQRPPVPGPQPEPDDESIEEANDDEGSNAPPDDAAELSSLSRDELLELAGDMDIEGSGKGGYITVKDLVKALEG